MNPLFSFIGKGMSFFVIAAGLCAMTMAPSAGYGGLLGTNANGTVRFDPNHSNFFDPAAVPGNPAIQRPVNGGVEFNGNSLAIFTQTGLNLAVTADIGDNTIQLTATNTGGTPDVITGNTVYRFGLFPQVGLVRQKIAGIIFDGGNAPPSGSLIFGDRFVQMTYLPGVMAPGQVATAHFTLSFVNVPEPTTYVLLGTMALIASLAAWRKKTRVLTSQQEA